MIERQLIWLVPALLFSIASFLPLINFQHWIFRSFDFVRLQLTAILIVLLITSIFIEPSNPSLKVISVLLLLVSIVYNIFILYPYFPLSQKQPKASPNSISLLSMNVLQKNKSYHKVIKTVIDLKPDILLTMESDSLWEEALKEIEHEYIHAVKVPMNNRYGMHLYTTLNLLDCKIHYLISEEYPSIEVRLQDRHNHEFVVWGIHPPPPSPTEKPTSKQKEGELMQLAKLIHNTELPVVVAGDFNNVSWSKISKLFVEITKLKDARIGKGFNSTFPADWPLLRFPIDLLFHSENILIHKLKVLPSVDSDHLPLFSTFHIVDPDVDSKKKLDTELKDEMNKKIKQGKKAAVVEN